MLPAPEKKVGKVDDIDRILSTRLRRRRMMLGLSQQELGTEVGVSVQQIQKYEKATNRISGGKLFALARFLGVPITYFYDPNNEDHYTSGNFFAAEEAITYTTDGSGATEKEIISLIKSFTLIKNIQTRKKIIELVKTMS